MLVQLYNEFGSVKEILYFVDEDNKNGWDSGGDWYEKYLKINTTQ